MRSAKKTHARKPILLGLWYGSTAANLACAALALIATQAQAQSDGWAVAPDPVYGGQYNAVGDPSVIRVGDGSYLMFHHCIDVLRDPQGGEVCLARSADGVHWRYARTDNSAWFVRSRLLLATIGGWDEAHETPFAVQVGTMIRLYVLGYKGSGVFSDPPSAGIGMVQSADPLAFPQMGAPILTPSVPGDAGGITSPSMVQTDGGGMLYYTGWSCSMADPACPAREKLTLMAVPLDGAGLPAGVPRRVLADPGVAWAHGGVSEAEVILGPDGRYYLFFSTLPGSGAGSAQSIGLGVADDPFGPFTIAADPIITPEDVTGHWARGGVLAPAVLIEDGQVRLWFHAFELGADGQISKARIGIATHDWPIWPAD